MPITLKIGALHTRAYGGAPGQEKSGPQTNCRTYSTNDKRTGVS